MANIPYPQWYPSSLNCELFHAPSIECELGDLTFYDSASGFVKPAGSFTWTTDLLTSQKAFVLAFAGLSDSRQLAGDPVAHPARLLFDIIAEFPCVSATFHPGDLVGVNGAPSLLEDQNLIKVSDPLAAIGKVLRRYAAATNRIKVRLVAAMFVPVGRLP